MEDEAKRLKNELLKVKDVARVEIYGVQTPTIDVTTSLRWWPGSGLTTADIARAFAAQNKVVDAGAVETDENRIRIESTGNFYSLDDIRQMTITSATGEHFRLADIARVEESYKTPAGNLMRIDGRPALGVAVATVSTGNVVDMAAAVAAEIARFERTMPDGFALTSIYDQGYESAVANRGFILNLIISVITVVAVLLFFIGVKNGVLIGSGLVFSIFATLMVMHMQGHRPATHVARGDHHCDGHARRQCHRGVGLGIGQHAARHAQARSDYARLLLDRHAVAGCYGNRHSDLSAHLLLAPYYRGAALFARRGHRCFADVQLGVRYNTDAFLHAGVRPSPASR